MPLIKFLGHIDPKGTQISLNLSPARFPNTDFGVALMLVATVKHSDIEVECHYDRSFPDELIHTWFYATGFIQAAINLAAFQMGVGVTVTLDHLEKTGGVIEPLSHFNPALPALCTAFSATHGYEAVLRLLLNEPKLGVALGDLVQSTTHPNLTLINCARAIDAIKKMIAGPTQKGAWALMHSALNVDASYLKPISENSTEHRHGNPIDVPTHIRQAVTERSWVVMDRFFHYRLRGGKPLPLSKFPLLSG